MVSPNLSFARQVVASSITDNRIKCHLATGDMDGAFLQGVRDDHCLPLHVAPPRDSLLQVARDPNPLTVYSENNFGVRRYGRAFSSGVYDRAARQKDGQVSLLPCVVTTDALGVRRRAGSARVD